MAKLMKLFPAVDKSYRFYIFKNTKIHKNLANGYKNFTGYVIKEHFLMGMTSHPIARIMWKASRGPNEQVKTKMKPTKKFY